MNSVSSVVEQMKILLDMGDGCLHGLYFTKSCLLQTAKRPHCLQDAELLKVRVKLEKKFPALPDTQKLPGWEHFVAESSRTVSELQPHFELLLDIAEFVIAAKEALKDIIVMIIDFKLSRNRMLVLLYFDLLVMYMRVMMMAQLLEERAGIAAMYHTAYGLTADANTSEAAGTVNKIRVVLDDSTDLSRHFIDFFFNAQAFIKMTLPQLRDSIEFANNIDDLRKNYVLNPVAEGDDMGKPANRKLSPSSPLSAYTELSTLDCYIDYVVFALLACPALLFEDAYSELLRVATMNRIVVPIFRDINLNIHLEFEKLSNVYPATSDTQVVVPKGFKLKNVLKTISRTSVSSAGLLQRSRRSLLQAELSALLNMIEVVPGLIGPKLPMLLAAAALARNELVAYFRHAEGVQIRKDSKAQYNGQHYAAEDICELLRELHRASSAVERHACIIVEYYREFLVRNDLKVLQPLCSECGMQITSLKSYFDAMMDALQGLISLTPPTPGDIDTAGDEAIMLEMAGFRLNWDRAVAVASSQPMRHAIKANAATFEPLAVRMLAAYERTNYATVASLQRLRQSLLDPYLLGWFRSGLQRAFDSTVKEPSMRSINSLYFLWPLQSILLNVHDDHPQEEEELGQKAVAVSNTMLTDCANFVLTLLKFLWDNLSALEAQHHPIEAAGRIERALQTKVKVAAASAEGGGGGNSSSGGDAAAAQAAALAAAMGSQEALPGCESEFWARKQIEKLVLIRQHITWLMTAARTQGAVVVFNTEYRIDVYFRDQIAKYFTSRLHSLFIANSSSNERMLRFSSAVRKFICGCRAVQFCFGFLHVDFACFLQQLLFRECQDMTEVPPPGLPLPLGYQPAAEDKGRLISKISRWFRNVAVEMSRPHSGFVWVPQQRNFISASHKNKHESISPSSAIGGSIELHLHHDELVQLVTLVGTQGVRTVQVHLMQLLLEQLDALLKFVAGNQSSFRHYEKNYCLMGTISSGAIQGMPEATDALRTIGIVLALREMLQGAVQSCSRIRCGDLQQSARTAVGSLDVWAQPTLATSLCCLAADVGVTEERDLPLTAAIAQLPSLKGDGSGELLSLFPTAAAVLFSCNERWDKAYYLAKYDAFENNEHCMQLALAKLFPCFHALLSGSDVTAATTAAVVSSGATVASSASPPPPPPTVTPKSAVALSQPEQLLFRDYAEKYLRIAAQILLVLRSAETSSSSGQTPYRAISMQLEYFARCCPSTTAATATTIAALGRGALEKYFPNALTHAAAMDVSLGRNRQSDSVGKFTHPQLQAE